jgi:hypothetical protein
MSWAILRPQVKDVLDTIGTLQEVSDSPKIRFSGYPAAHVVPSENTNDYETTSENIRTYAFTVRVFYDTKETPIEDAFSALEEVVDNVIDAFDQEDLKGGSTRKLGISLPAKYTFLNVLASPGNWGELTEEQLIMAEIKVKVRVSVDIS